MTQRYLILGLLALTLGAGVGACGSPTNPSVTPPVVTPVDPGPVVNNTPPVIGTFTVQGTRTNEPKNFADVSESVPVTVQVTDAESNPNDLQYNWTATLGSFSGTGRNVTWKAPAAVDGPTVVTLNLEVVETYTSQGKQVTNNPKGSVTVSLHDSIKEVGDLARLFLLDFSNSGTPTATVMRNFQPDCYGTEEETGDVSRNRENYTIIDSTIGPASTLVNFGGICNFRQKPGDACARVPSRWVSIANKDVYDQFGQLAAYKNQRTETPFGTDQVAAMYYPTQQRWKLCDSQYDDQHSSVAAKPSVALPPALVP